MRQVWTVLVALSLVGCGVADDKAVSDFEEGDIESLCDELATDTREVTCEGDGFEVTLEIGETYDECVATLSETDAYTNCDLTAGDLRACQDAWDAYTDEELCSLEAGFPDECEPLFTCALGL